jgi:hypothetical protein
MTGQTRAIARWQALDRAGDDTCRLARTEDGWLLVGHARFTDAMGHAALDYVVRLDADWRSLSADIAGLHDHRQVRIALDRKGDDWHLDGQVVQGLGGALDVDLSFTPATNLMPLRRMTALGVATVRGRAALLRYPDIALQPLDQIYTVQQDGLVRYEGAQTGFVTMLTVDDSGFVTRYPGAWQGEVTHAAD